jgi:hypothetical protein
MTVKRIAYPSTLLATLILAACGGGSDTQQSTSNGTPTSVSAASSPEVAQTTGSTDDASANATVYSATDPALLDASQEPVMQAAASDIAASSDPSPTLLATTTVVTAPAYHLYVSPTGSDSNAGTETSPFRTILKASKAAKPGTLVHVAAGTYYGGFTTSTSGTATARISYVSTVPGGAKIVPASGTTARTAWSVMGNYVDVIGFEVDGKSNLVWKNGITTGASYVLFQGNHVHHIATDPAMCDGNGGSGLNATHYWNGVNVDMIGNVVDHIGSRGCKYIQGLYMGTSGNLKNNVAYDIGNWGVHLWHDANHVNIVDNTIARSGGGITVGGGGFYHITVTDYVNVSNNIVYGNDKGISEQGTNGTHNTYTNNLLYANGKYNTPSVSSASQQHVSGTVNADPQFVDYANNNYRVKSTSRAINNGSSTYAPAADIVNVARPQGGRVDIGAYEYVF